MTSCFRITDQDNVAVLLDDLGEPGPLRVLGAGGVASISSLEKIPLGHKMAVTNIADGEAVIKFGVPIGRASRQILAGQWVHLHNCMSSFDERSQTLDVHNGAATDTKYE